MIILIQSWGYWRSKETRGAFLKGYSGSAKAKAKAKAKTKVASPMNLYGLVTYMAQNLINL
jgi:hypothetical protein